MLTSKVPNSPKASGGGVGNKEAPTGGIHCSDVDEVAEVDSDDEDEVLETYQNGRWQKINVQVSGYIVKMRL